MVTEFLISILFTLVFLRIGKYIWDNRKLYQLSWQLPGPIALPLLGNALKFFGKDEDILRQAIDVISPYKSPMRFWFGTKFTLIFSDVYQIEKIMSSMKFATKDKIYRFIKEFNGEGLISGSGLKWRRDRHLMYPLFVSKNVQCYTETVLHHTDILMNCLKNEENGNLFNVEPYFHRCAADIVNETIIGIKTNAQEGHLDHLMETITRMYEIVYARIVKVWLQIEWIFKFTHYYKEMKEGKNLIHGFFQEALQNAKERYKMNASTNSFLDQILEIRHENPDFATDLDIVHHLSTLYSASEDTVTTICSFAVVLLGMYPNVQNQLIKEINFILGKYLTTENVCLIDKIAYLDMCIKEVLRLYPIAPFIMRTTSEDTTIGDVNIPKDCSVVVAIYNIHRDVKHWEKPNEFYPEHFSASAVSKRHPYAFIPFSAGPRGCLGKTYSYLVMKIMLVKFLQNYIIESTGTIDDIQLKTDISVRAKNNSYLIKIKPRH